MDCKSVIAPRVRGTIFLSFVLLFCALGVQTRSAEPSGLATATLHGLEGHRLKLAAPHGRGDRAGFLFDGMPDLERLQSDTQQSGRDLSPPGRSSGSGFASTPT